jgi:predicted metal-binding protein
MMCKDVIDLIKQCGFECVGSVSAPELKVREEVRDMCAADKCERFGRSWSCPPVCGDLNHFQERIDARTNCIVFQTIGQLEDEFDIETIIETSDRHRDRVLDFADRIAQIHPDSLLLVAGSCTICPTCTYPDEPCRFPDKAFVSMEAAGLVVSDVCTSAGIPYNHGKNTIAYVSCICL